MKSNKEKYQARKLQGVCVKCGRKSAAAGYAYCMDCREKEKEQKKADYLFYREKGYCVKCHRSKAVPGRAMCENCAARQRARYAARRQKNGGQLVEKEASYS